VASRGPDWNTFYGAVYVFTRSNSTWQQQAILRPSENEYGWRRFGEAIDLSDDGDTLVAKSDNDVYVLERQNSIWQPTQRLVQSNLPSEDTYYPPGFGAALSISGDGSTVAISWPQESSASTGVQGYQGSDSDLTSGGAAYIFEKEAGSWQQSAFLKASNPNSSYGYGYAISLDWSGDTVAVSAASLPPKRLGFTFEGIFRQATIYKNRNRDTAWFSLLDSEWPIQRTKFLNWLSDENFDEQGQQKKALMSS